MINVIENSSKRAKNCSGCGRLLQNPGYNKNYVSCFGGACAGRLREWGEYVTYVYSVDDGRNETGQFHHKKSITLTRIEYSDRTVNFGGVTT